MKNLAFKNRLQLYDIHLSKSDHKIAEYVLQNLISATEDSIVHLADKIGTSSPTITRFCKKLHYRNFTELQALLKNEQLIKQHPPEIVDKIRHYYTNILNFSMDILQPKLINQLATQIIEARRVFLFGIGSSGLTAKELAIRLTNMNIDATAVSDSYSMAAKANLLNEEDILIIFCPSGTHPVILNACQLAKKHQTTICSITQSAATPLTDLADITCFTTNTIQNDDPAFLNDQLANLFFIDVLTYSLLELNTTPTDIDTIQHPFLV